MSAHQRDLKIVLVRIGTMNAFSPQGLKIGFPRMAA